MRIKESLVKELFRTNEEGVISVGQTIKPNNEEIEVTSPLKTKIKDDCKENGEVKLRLSKGKIGPSKGKWKKISREIGKAHNVSMKPQELSVGMKRTENTDTLAETAENNDCFKVEMSGAWEPPDSSSVGRISPTIGSQSCVSGGNKSKEEDNGEGYGEN